MNSPAVLSEQGFRAALVDVPAPIARCEVGVTAFIGRALRGPVCTPITLRSFEEYQRVFGGLWQPSPMSYAVAQFFLNGGTRCIVVRLINGARPPTLRLPAGERQYLTLVGIAPGTREFLRAAVDYDGIDVKDSDTFNLVVQRLNAPDSERVEQQEIYRRVSCRVDAERPLTTALARSTLVRIRGQLPEQRPALTGAAPPAAAVGYISSGADGDDGADLSVYDVIGNARDRSGLFALEHAPPFNFLVLPALGRGRDVGPAALMVALKLCRERNALLLVDPPLEWRDTSDVLAAMKSWPVHSEQAAMFYPRLRMLDRATGREELFGPSAAAAGFMARHQDWSALWTDRSPEEAMLRPSMRVDAVSDVERGLLLQCGINVMAAARRAAADAMRLRTLTTDGTPGDLGLQCLAMLLVSSIRSGTRWVAHRPSEPAVWQQMRTQVTQFLEGLAVEGAFVGGSASERYFVICDERINAMAEHQGPTGPIHLLFGVALTHPGRFQTWMITHSALGDSARSVTVNPLALPSPLEGLYGG